MTRSTTSLSFLSIILVVPLYPITEVFEILYQLGFIYNSEGSDATDPIRAFHPNLAKIEKSMKALEIGELDQESRKTAAALIEFRELRYRCHVIL